jgi:integrase
LKGKNSGIQYLREIKPQDGQSYATYLSKTKGSPNTFNKHTGFLRLFFQTLEEPARMTANPFGKIKRKKLKTDARRELSLEELKTVLDCAKGELNTLLYIGTFTGLRLGDCATLKWGEVDLLRGIIKRVPSKTKGNEQKPVTIGIPSLLHGILSETPKSRRRGFVVPTFAELYTYENADGKRIRQSMITEQVQAHFRKLGINTHKEGTGTQIKPDPEKPGEYIEEKTGKRAVVEVGFHSLRHTFVSLQAERGTPLAVVQAIVGHGNPAMTKHYTHIGEEAAKAAALAMPSNIVDADFEVLDEALPPWACELAEELNSKNWKQVKKELLKRGRRK